MVYFRAMILEPQNLIHAPNAGRIAGSTKNGFSSYSIGCPPGFFGAARVIPHDCGINRFAIFINGYDRQALVRYAETTNIGPFTAGFRQRLGRTFSNSFDISYRFLFDPSRLG